MELQSYVLQSTSDPYEGEWEDLALLVWRENQWHVTFFKDLPLNAHVKRWCHDGITQIVQDDQEESLAVVPPSSPEFLPVLTERLGKLKYRCIEARDAS